MVKIHVQAQPDFLEGLTVSARPINAIAELVWNGFDAGSDRVQVFLTLMIWMELSQLGFEIVGKAFQ